MEQTEEKFDFILTDQCNRPEEMNRMYRCFFCEDLMFPEASVKTSTATYVICSHCHALASNEFTKPIKLGIMEDHTNEGLLQHM